LHIARQPPRLLEDDREGPPDLGEAEEYRRLQVLMVRSRRVLSMALHKPSVAQLDVIKGQGDPLAWLES
jgi:hypothetical protein